MADVLVLGAEAQAASSIACAYPDRAITFVSDHDILDGADLPNVRLMRANPAEGAALSQSAVCVVPLCPRWLPAGASLPLSQLFERVDRKFPGRMLPVLMRPGEQGRWILKGDRWHRPDAPLSGTAQQLEDASDPHGCGLVYQPMSVASATIMSIGHRGTATQLGCVQVFDERFFWDNVLQAGETVDAPDVVAASVDILDALNYQGYFTMNWLRTDGGLRLSSMRPVPRAIFQMFRKGGVDLLEAASRLKVVSAGLRMIAVPTYASFQRLRA
jgi:hypothetical protein